MERIEKIGKALDQIGKDIKEAETLGTFSVGRKVELAERGTRLAYAAMREMLEELKEIKANG
jgi:DNA anti-recombination protein RmuC